MMPTGSMPAACMISRGTYTGMKPIALRPGAAAFHSLTEVKFKSSNSVWQRSMICGMVRLIGAPI